MELIKSAAPLPTRDFTDTHDLTHPVLKLENTSVPFQQYLGVGQYLV